MRSKALVVAKAEPGIDLQCQIPPCKGRATHPASTTPLLCERHYLLDTRQGKFCPLLMWMAMFWLAEYWKKKARQAKEAGEDVDLHTFRAPAPVKALNDLILIGREQFFGQFPRLLVEGDDGKWVNETFPTLANKPQVHMIGIYLRMLDAFSGYPAVRVTEGRPVLTAYINQPPSWVELHLNRLKPFKYPKGQTLLVVEHPWDQGTQKLEGSEQNEQ